MGGLHQHRVFRRGTGQVYEKMLDVLPKHMKEAAEAEEKLGQAITEILRG